MPYISTNYCSTLQLCHEVADRNGIVIRRSYRRKPRTGTEPSRGSRYEILIDGKVAAHGDAKAVRAFMRNLDLPGRYSPGWPADLREKT